MGHVEVHFHLLPGIDDGPSSMDESLALAAAAARDGTRTIVATPHVHPEHVVDPSQVPIRVHELTDRLRRERIPVEVRAGGELSHVMVERLTRREIESIAQGPAGKRWVLLEGPMGNETFDGFTEAADELRELGFAVVVAHPERALQTSAADRALGHELAAGSVLQLNAGSFTGEFGEPARAAAMWRLRTAARVVIASDAHGGIRPPRLKLTLEALHVAGERAHRLVGAVPRALLDLGLAVGWGAVQREPAAA